MSYIPVLVALDTLRLSPRNIGPSTYYDLPANVGVSIGGVPVLAPYGGLTSIFYGQGIRPANTAFTLGNVGSSPQVNVINDPMTANIAASAQIAGSKDGDLFLIARTPASTGTGVLNVGYGAANGSTKALATGQWVMLMYLSALGYFVPIMGGQM